MNISIIRVAFVFDRFYVELLLHEDHQGDPEKEREYGSVEKHHDSEQAEIDIGIDEIDGGRDDDRFHHSGDEDDCRLLEQVFPGSEGEGFL